MIDFYLDISLDMYIDGNKCDGLLQNVVCNHKHVVPKMTEQYKNTSDRFIQNV